MPYQGLHFDITGDCSSAVAALENVDQAADRLAGRDFAFSVSPEGVDSAIRDVGRVSDAIAAGSGMMAIGADTSGLDDAHGAVASLRGGVQGLSQDLSGLSGLSFGIGGGAGLSQFAGDLSGVSRGLGELGRSMEEVAPRAGRLSEAIGDVLSRNAVEAHALYEGAGGIRELGDHAEAATPKLQAFADVQNAVRTGAPSGRFGGGGGGDLGGSLSGIDTSPGGVDGPPLYPPGDGGGGRGGGGRGGRGGGDDGMGLGSLGMGGAMVGVVGAAESLMTGAGGFMAVKEAIKDVPVLAAASKNAMDNFKLGIEGAAMSATREGVPALLALGNTLHGLGTEIGTMGADHMGTALAGAADLAGNATQALKNLDPAVENSMKGLVGLVDAGLTGIGSPSSVAAIDAAGASLAAPGNVKGFGSLVSDASTDAGILGKAGVDILGTAGQFLGAAPDSLEGPILGGGLAAMMTRGGAGPKALMGGLTAAGLFAGQLEESHGRPDLVTPTIAGEGVGAAIGSLFGPVGTAVGGVVGGGIGAGIGELTHNEPPMPNPVHDFAKSIFPGLPDIDMRGAPAHAPTMDEIKKSTAAADKAYAADPTNLHLYQEAAFADAVLKQHTEAATLGMGGIPAGGIPGLPGSGGGGGTPFIGAEGAGSWTASGAGWMGPGGVPIGGPLGLGGSGGGGGGTPFIGGPGGAGEWTASGPGWSNDATKPQSDSFGQGGHGAASSAGGHMVTNPLGVSVNTGNFMAQGPPNGFGAPQLSPQGPGPNPSLDQSVNGVAPATQFMGPTLTTGPNMAVSNLGWYGPQAMTNPQTSQTGLAGLMTGKAMTDVGHPQMNTHQQGPQGVLGMGPGRSVAPTTALNTLNSALSANAQSSAHAQQQNTTLAQSLSQVSQFAQTATQSAQSQTAAQVGQNSTQQQSQSQNSSLSQSLSQVGQSATTTASNLGMMNQSMNATTQSAQDLGQNAAQAMGPVAAMPTQANESASAATQALSDAGPSMSATAGSVGASAMGSMAAGISSGAGQAADAASSAASGAASAAASASDSQSPSRVWMGLGKDMTDGGAIGINRGAPAMAGAAASAIHGVTDAARGVASDSGLMVGFSFVESMLTGEEQAIKTSLFQQLGFADIQGAKAKASLGALGLLGPAGSGAQSYQLSAQEVSFATGTAANAPAPQPIVIQPQHVYLDGKHIATIADQRINVAFGQFTDQYGRQRDG